jgi:hypothetical protein
MIGISFEHVEDIHMCTNDAISWMVAEVKVTIVVVAVAVAVIMLGRHNDRPANTEERNVAATNSMALLEYDASTSTLATQSTQLDGGRGGRTGGRFGPRCNN